MKNKILTIVLFLLASVAIVSNVNAQEEEKSSPVSISADVVSRYIWRGSPFSNSPAIQPGIEFSTGGFALGAWGSYTTGGTYLGQEADLYASYTFADVITIGVTDYFFPNESWLTDTTGTSVDYFDFDNHILEISAGLSLGDFTLLGAVNVSGDDDNSMYFEAGYSFGILDLTLGAGNGFYTSDGDFNVVNVGLSFSKDISITDKFSLPIFSQFIVNPDLKSPFIVFGFSL